LGPERTTTSAVRPAPQVGLRPPGSRGKRGLLFQPGMTWPLIPLNVGVEVLLPVWLGFGGGVGVVGWSLVENCTVDASILFSVVVKLSRANGGCLGTRSR
jgi:hypothetical protein